jgi:hypothetical protein
MKYSSRFISNVRALFGLARVCALFSLLGYPLVVLFIPSMTDKYALPDAALVNVAPDSVSVRVSDASGGSKVALKRLTGTLALQEGPARAPFATITRTSIFAVKMVRAVFLFFVFHLAWQLCRNLEQHEVFSERNLVFVRRLGLVLSVYSWIGMLVNTWAHWRIDNYVTTHLTFEGAKVTALVNTRESLPAFFESMARHGQFDQSLFLTGLGVIALAEVFRRGLMLKQEADLTV